MLEDFRECVGVSDAMPKPSEALRLLGRADGGVELALLRDGYWAFRDGGGAHAFLGGHLCRLDGDCVTTALMQGKDDPLLLRVRLRPPKKGEPWCGLPPDVAAKAWRTLSAMPSGRPYVASWALEAAVDAFRSPSAGALLARLRFQTLVGAFAANAAEEPAPRRGGKGDAFVAAVDALGGGYPLARELAHEIGCSMDWLKRDMRVHYGLSPGFYLSARKYAYAIRRIADGARVRDVLAAIGMKGTHFMREFRLITGLTVREYRRTWGVGELWESTRRTPRPEVNARSESKRR